MKQKIPPTVAACVETWPQPAQTVFATLREICHDAAKDAQIGLLEESLKWGQPAWKPVKPRIGSTLRAMWMPNTPDLFSLYVGCKTDLASRMRDLYPDLAQNDGRRHIGIRLCDPLPETAMAHLASMILTYHKSNLSRS